MRPASYIGRFSLVVLPVSFLGSTINASADNSIRAIFSECTNYQNPPEIRIKYCTNFIAIEHSDRDSLVVAYNNRGVANREKGQLDQAISDYSTGMNYMTQPSAIIYSNRALAYGDLKNFSAALKDFKSALKIDRTNYQIYALRADLFAQMGEYNEAIRDLTAVILSKPEDAEYYYRRGFSFFSIDKCEPAIKDFLKTVSIKENSSLAYYYMAQCYGKMGNLEQTLRYLKIASKYKKENERFIDKEIDSLIKFMNDNHSASKLTVGD